MNDIFRAIILGIVEGLTEFLPVSSTGHMILVQPLIGIGEDDSFWKVNLFFSQIGAILAVVVYFWGRLWTLAKDWEPANWREHILPKLILATIPAGVLGLLLDDFMDKHLLRVPVVAGALLVGGVAILVIEKTARSGRYTDAATIPLRVAIIIGAAQALAMIPGTSRSGASIMCALLLGLTPAAAAEFSFFLAIPLLLGAGMLKLVKRFDEIQPDQFVTLAIGFIVSFIVAWLVIAAFMKFIKTHKFTSFAIYRIVIGGVVLVALWGKEIR